MPEYLIGLVGVAVLRSSSLSASPPRRGSRHA